MVLELILDCDVECPASDYNVKLHKKILSYYRLMSVPARAYLVAFPLISYAFVSVNLFVYNFVYAK